ncbi:MAG: Coenzyme F420 hydrogenase/dehydrogenase, beta subunit C-terminal domain [Methanomicrobia archaeon]|nr:Coenzyme F420 hydrogenase/dehydrogenase, beta subunit C-terminal domain [Methanomicrobia archaeon]
MEKRKEFSDLKRDVIDAGTCSSCGGCVAICRLLDLDFLSMDPVSGLPILGGNQSSATANEACTTAPLVRAAMGDELQCPIDCGYCYYQCPRVEKPELQEGLEEYYEVVNSDEEITAAGVAEDVLTSLLASALADALVEGVVTVADADGGAQPEVRIAMYKGALIEHAGGNYGAAAAMTGLADAIVKYGLWSVALVGTPCQMEAYEKMLTVGRETHNAHNFSSVVRLRIAVFCDGVFTNKGEKREGCKICDDLTGQFADLSVGSFGAAGGASVVIVHTDVGKEAFESAQHWGFIEAKPLDRSAVAALRQKQAEKREAGLKEQVRRAHSAVQ